MASLKLLRAPSNELRAIPTSLTTAALNKAVKERTASQSIYKWTSQLVVCSPPKKLFHTERTLRAHGVFNGLAESRIVTPWIEALRMQQAGERIPESKNTTASSSAVTALAPKLMSESVHRVVLPLAQDPWLSDTYLNASGKVRLGAIFMDLDALAGIIAYKHTGDQVTLVTAACDRITIENPPTELCDLEYSGSVTYATGRSSLEVTCRVAKVPKAGQEAKDEDNVLTCMFTMVALDPETKKPTNIAPLSPSTPAEQRLFEQGEARSKHKKSLASATLLKQPPNANESALIHNMWLRQLAYHDPNNPLRQPQNLHLMSATKLEDTSIMQPQYRNRHHYVVFGGFLMRHSYELAFACCANFARTRPTFISLDPSKFLNPVPVGSVLYLTATVAYTDPPLVDDSGRVDPDGTQNGSAPPKQTRVQVRVDTKVRDIGKGSSKPTGQFNYTFMVDGNVHVMPQTYSEFMMYIDAKRRVEMVDQDTGKSRQSGPPVPVGGDNRITE